MLEQALFITDFVNLLTQACDCLAGLIAVEVIVVCVGTVKSRLTGTVVLSKTITIIMHLTAPGKIENFDLSEGLLNTPEVSPETPAYCLLLCR